MELYFIAVGDAAEPFGRYFAGDEHFFKVEESESIAEKLDYVTRQSLVESSTIPTNPLGFDDQDDNPIEEEEDDDSFDCGDADPLDDDPEKEESKDDADEEDDFIDDSEDDESNEDEDNEDDEEDEDDISLDDIIGF